MKNYRTFNEVEESYFRDHPEEIDDYVNLIFEENFQCLRLEILST